MRRLSEIQGVRIKYNAFHFKEFVLDFSAAGRTVNEINSALLDKGIFGGKDLGTDSGELNGCALYAVTEVTTQGDIDRLVDSLTTILS
jgi:glycine dehydrogenase subunit 1